MNKYFLSMVSLPSKIKEFIHFFLKHINCVLLLILDLMFKSSKHYLSLSISQKCMRRQETMKTISWKRRWSSEWRLHLLIKKIERVLHLCTCLQAAKTHQSPNSQTTHSRLQHLSKHQKQTRVTMISNTTIGLKADQKWLETNQDTMKLQASVKISSNHDLFPTCVQPVLTKMYNINLKHVPQLTRQGYQLRDKTTTSWLQKKNSLWKKSSIRNTIQGF